MIKLCEITSKNYNECINLKTTEEQKNMGIIASNKDSLEDAKNNPNIARPFAIYSDHIMIGFVMFAFDEEINEYWLWRFMIDEHYQGRGYAKESLRIIQTF